MFTEIVVGNRQGENEFVKFDSLFFKENKIVLKFETFEFIGLKY